MPLWAAEFFSLVAALGVIYLALATVLTLRLRSEPPRTSAGGRKTGIEFPVLLCGEDRPPKSEAHGPMSAGL